MPLLFEIPTGTEWIGVALILAILFIPKVLYILTLKQTLSAISPKNRKFGPQKLWLLLIPGYWCCLAIFCHRIHGRFDKG